MFRPLVTDQFSSPNMPCANSGVATVGSGASMNRDPRFPKDPQQQGKVQDQQIF